MFPWARATCVNCIMKSSVIAQSNNASVFNEGEVARSGNTGERSDAPELPLTASTSREGKGNRRNGSTISDPWHLRQSFRIFARGSRGNSPNGASLVEVHFYEKLPFGPANRIFLGNGSYSMKTGDDRFGRWFVEIPEIISANLVSLPKGRISRAPPL